MKKKVIKNVKTIKIRVRPVASLYSVTALSVKTNCLTVSLVTQYVEVSGSSNRTTAQVNGLSPGTQYYFSVQAQGAQGRSLYSSPALVATMVGKMHCSLQTLGFLCMTMGQTLGKIPSGEFVTLF